MLKEKLFTIHVKLDGQYHQIISVRAVNSYCAKKIVWNLVKQLKGFSELDFNRLTYDYEDYE